MDTTFRWGGLTVEVRGRANRPAEQVAAAARAGYLEDGRFDLAGLDGAFTIRLRDRRAGRVLLYRHLIDPAPTYYRAGRGLSFAGNLADLPGVGNFRPELDEDALPAMFLFRALPGRQTLVRGCHRLLPGEEVAWDGRRLARRMRTTFADLRGEPTRPEGLEPALSDILAGGDSLRIDLLSGGVDSTLLHALSPAGRRVSASASVDHPRTRPDDEYAATASAALGGRHTFVPITDRYIDLLADSVAACGEPVNHVQSAYFYTLGRALADRGVTEAVCGEGADSLIGVSYGKRLQEAAVLRRALPCGPLRRAAAGLCDRLGRGGLATSLRLADFREDVEHPDHPVNRTGVYGDAAEVAAAFGERPVREAFGRRRELLDLYRVPADPMDQVHAISLLTEAADTVGVWSALLGRHGVDMLCPYLDSRFLKFAVNLPRRERYPPRRPKRLLKRALARRVGGRIAYREKRGFGQPVFEWLGDGGQLRGPVERVAERPFAPAAASLPPSWFLFNLLTLDVWQEHFARRFTEEHGCQSAPGWPAMSSTR